MVVFTLGPFLKEGKCYMTTPFTVSSEHSKHPFVPRIIKINKLVRIKKVYYKKIRKDTCRFFYATCETEILGNIFLIDIYKEVDVNNKIRNFNARIIEKNGVYNALGIGFDFNIIFNNVCNNIGNDICNNVCKNVYNIGNNIKNVRIKSKIKLIRNYY